MAANVLTANVRAYMHEENVQKRYIRLEEATSMFSMNESDVLLVALAAGAKYQLPKIVLIHKERMESFLKHLYRVPGMAKQIEKKFVRIGEASIIYSIGHHRMIELARDAGAVYKLGDSQGGSILISLDIFDEYLERYHEPAKELKTPLYKAVGKEV